MSLVEEIEEINKEAQVASEEQKKEEEPDFSAEEEAENSYRDKIKQ